jgi:adenosylcobinamide kinase/adenosylcobinamide-phosphate guanylyltransferase
MTGNRVILVGGGVRSGKSAFALSRAQILGARRAFVATAEALDAEMRERIAVHRHERGDDFHTVEEPIALSEAIGKLRDVDVVVIDCLTLWLSNLLLRDESPQRILQRVDELTEVLRRRMFHCIVVTNEVGMGVVPVTPLGRAFRDLAGLAHQRITRRADEVYVAILGSVLRIRPAPVEVQPMGGAHAELL